MVACCPKRLPPQKVVVVHDTTVRERIIHDTATFEIEKIVEKNVTKDTISRLENVYAKSEASIDSCGFLHHSLETKPHTVYVPYTVEVCDTVVVEKEAQTIIEQVEKPLTWWQGFQIRGFWLLLMVIGAFLAGEFIKERLI